MKTDPRKACANVDQRLFWAIVHDLIAHPLMSVTCWARWTVRFHDFTSHRAWPRPSAVLRTSTHDSGLFGILRVEDLAQPCFFRVHHGRFSHAITVKAINRKAAIAQATAWFERVAEVIPHSSVSAP